MSDPSAAVDVEGFVAKWRGAWPEWPLVEGFVPAPQRALADAWQALQFEWQEAAWRGDEARPGEAKLLWWIEELEGWAKGVRRHPLGAVLQREAAPWREVARALPVLAASRTRPRDADDAREALSAFSAAVAEAERVLLPGGSSPSAVTATWLHARLARHPQQAVPVAFGDDTRAWTRELLRRWPETRGITPARALLLGLAGGRLARGDAAAPLPPWRALWAGWRSARS